jgi:dolichol-phosphate mannosyltransferase
VNIALARQPYFTRSARFGAGALAGLFMARLGLYKAPAARHGIARTRLRTRDFASSTLFHEGIERSPMVALSVVVPVKDEAENVAPLAREIVAALSGENAEIIFVDDGSLDSTVAELKALAGEIPALRIVQHGRNIGQSRALRTGVRAARSEIVVTLDGDGQNDPADIPNLLAILRDGEAEKVGMVSGVRRNRQDSFNKRVTSAIANSVRGWMLADHAVDSGCGLKVFKRELFLALPFFDNMHRFLIALVWREGYQVRFAEVNHRPREHGRSKYSARRRTLTGLVDMIGVRWLQRRFKGPAESKEL